MDLVEATAVRTARTFLAMAILAVGPLGVSAAGYRSVRDPVGEELYSSGQLGRMAPFAIVAGGFALAYLFHRIRRKATQSSTAHEVSHHC